LNIGGAGDIVYFQNLVKVIHVDGHRGVAVGRNVQAPYHTGRTAIRNGGVAVLIAPVQDGFQFVLIARVCDCIRGVVKFTAQRFE
jgi:hypothetical protein